MPSPRTLLIAVIAGIALGLLGWFVDALYLPIIALGPFVTGLLAGARRIQLRAMLAMWVASGMFVLFADWIVNDEDQAFHLIVIAFTALTCAAGHAVGGLLARRRLIAP